MLENYSDLRIQTSCNCDFIISFGLGSRKVIVPDEIKSPLGTGVMHAVTSKFDILSSCMIQGLKRLYLKSDYISDL